MENRHHRSVKVIFLPDNPSKRTENSSDFDTCCNCRHFRMWKPEREYCTVKKTQVNPLKKGCSDYKERKGLRIITLK